MNLQNKTIVILIAIIMLLLWFISSFWHLSNNGVILDTWTEGYGSPGFKSPHTTELNFKYGGFVIFTANASSTKYKELQNKITLTVDLDGSVCSEVYKDKPTSELLISTSCELELSPGPHRINVDINIENYDKNALSDKLDYEFNSIDGTVTRTMYSTE